MPSPKGKQSPAQSAAAPLRGAAAVVAKLALPPPPTPIGYASHTCVYPVNPSFAISALIIHSDASFAALGQSSA